MELFFVVIVTHFIALLSPGPDFFLILTTLFREGRNASKSTCMGIALGNLIIICSIFACLFLLGKFNPQIFNFVKWGGIIYLSYLSIRCFTFAIHADLPLGYSLELKPTTTITQIKSLLLGLQSSLLNPKNILFYSSILLVIYQHFNMLQLSLISIWMVSIVLIWNLFLVKLLSLKQARNWFKAHIQAIYYLCAFCFAVFSVVLMFH